MKRKELTTLLSLLDKVTLDSECFDIWTEYNNLTVKDLKYKLADLINNY